MGNQTSLASNQTPPKISFVLGLLAGIAVLSTVGFFVLLAKGGTNEPVNINQEITGGGKEIPEVIPAKKSSGMVDKWKAKAADLGLNTEQFNNCLDSDQYASLVKSEMVIGQKIGITGTPGTFINGELVKGALPYESVKAIIDSHLDDTPEEIAAASVDLPNISSQPMRGNPEANVTIIEFSDFECPYCSRFQQTVEQVLAEYPEQVRLVYLHFPLSFHAEAQKAAEASECAQEQGKFWEMHDYIFQTI